MNPDSTRFESGLKSMQPEASLNPRVNAATVRQRPNPPTHHIGLHSLPVRGTLLINVLAHTVPAHEGDCLDVWAVTDRIHCLLLAMNDVEHTLGETCLVQ